MSLVPIFLGMTWDDCPVAKPRSIWGTEKVLRNRCLAQQIAGEWMFTPQHNPIGIESSTYPLIVGGCGWIISIRITVDRRTAFSSLLVKSIFLIDFRYSHDFPCHFQARDGNQTCSLSLGEVSQKKVKSSCVLGLSPIFEAVVNVQFMVDDTPPSTPL